MVLFVIGSVWWNWDHIIVLPGVSQLLMFIKEREPIPHVSGNKPTIAVVHFDNDSDQKNEKILLDQLGTFEGLAVLPIPRQIQMPSGVTQEESIEAGRKQALDLLTKSGAQALIWGSVLENNGQSAVRLRWTVSRGEKERDASGRYQFDFDLPSMFWKDLTNTIKRANLVRE